MSGFDPKCMETRNFLESGSASSLAYTEIVAYTRSWETDFRACTGLVVPGPGGSGGPQVGDL